MTTSKRITPTPAAAMRQRVSDREFPEMPPRGDIQNFFHLYEPGYATTLRRHLAAGPKPVFVGSEFPLAWSHDQRGGLLIPDLLIAFNVDRAAIIAQRGYDILERGKAPDFVLEVASIYTARNDEIGKRAGYETYGVTEYWRFDPTGGQRYRTGLAGDRLVDGVYRPIDIIRTDDGHYWGYSAILNLNLCWEGGELWWHDPAANRYLTRHEDEINGRMAAEGALIISQAERDDIAAERDAVTAERDTVAAERDAATAERDTFIAERDAATAERDAVIAERDTFIAERDAALARHAAAIVERDAALARHAAARARKLELEAELRRLRNQ